MENEKFIDSSEINEIVKNLTLFDDYFMSVIFDKNIPATQMVLRTILGKQDIKVKSVTGQRTLKNPLTKLRFRGAVKVQSLRGQDFTAVC